MDKIVHLILIQSDDQIGMDEIIRRVSEALQGNVIELRRVEIDSVTPSEPAEVIPPAPKPEPLYKAKVIREVIARDTTDKETRRLPAGTIVSVWSEHNRIGKYDDRVVISDPSMPIEHIWKNNIQSID